MLRKIRFLLKDEEGQLMPFLAICMVIMIGFGALSLSLSMIYKDRMNIRDALDAAALAALTPAEAKEEATWYDEEYIEPKTDANGNVLKSGYWKKTEFDAQPFVVLNNDEAEAAALAYFEKNMRADNLKYKIKDWDLQIKFDQSNYLQVHKDRPHTEGIVDSWQKDFPRYVTVTINAKIETTSSMGAMFGRETIVTGLATKQYKELRD